MIASSLKTIGGDLNCHGNKEMNEESFPALETVDGDLILAGANFSRLPANLRVVGGRGIISRSDMASLAAAMAAAAESGIIKGGVFYID